MTGPVGLATTLWGDGRRRALLLHGLTSASTTWWRVGPVLAKLGYTVVAPDLRGHGNSPAGDDLSIESYRDDVLLLGGGWDLLVGHSLGGVVAAALVETDPDFAGRVVYEDPAADWRLAAEFIAESPERVGTATIAGIAAEHPDWEPDEVRYKVESLNSCRRDVEARTVADVFPRDIWSAMLAAELPGLVIAADLDVGSLVSAAQEAQAEGSPLLVVRITGAGHSVHRDAPDEFIELLTEFAMAPVSAPQAS
jgi:pimeloyl-ACP methyl ester carboxylesterase